MLTALRILVAGLGIVALVGCGDDPEPEADPSEEPDFEQAGVEYFPYYSSAWNECVYEGRHDPDDTTPQAMPRR